MIHYVIMRIMGANYLFSPWYLTHLQIQTSCQAYLTFRSNPPHNSPATIGLLLGSEPSLVADANNMSSFDIIPANTQILIPINNCSCSGPYYQHNTSYKLSSKSDTYFLIANDTYQGLTTCQALMAQNPYGDRNLTVGLNLEVPLRCACPTPNQTAAGVNYLLIYMITWDEDISSLAQIFSVDKQSELDANQLTDQTVIFPFTPILVPTKPALIHKSVSPSPPPPPPPTTPINTGSESGTNNNKRWVFVGGASALLRLSAFLLWLFCRLLHGHSHKGAPKPIICSLPGRVLTKKTK